MLGFDLCATYQRETLKHGRLFDRTTVPSVNFQHTIIGLTAAYTGFYIEGVGAWPMESSSANGRRAGEARRSFPLGAEVEQSDPKQSLVRGR